jgi:hypothetical protein
VKTNSSRPLRDVSQGDGDRVPGVGPLPQKQLEGTKDPKGYSVRSWSSEDDRDESPA